MISQTTHKYFTFLVAILGSLTTLIITPSYSSEPVDLPKLLVMVPLCLAIFFIAFIDTKKLKTRNFVVPKILILLFIIHSILVLIFAKSEFNQQFFGATGRNTGFLTYISLSLMFFSLINFVEERMLKGVALSLLLVGTASSFYGFIQITHNDPVKWNNPYTPMISFLGNPDFASSFIAFSSAIAVSLLFSKKLAKKFKVGLLCILVVSMISIEQSHAQQGILVIGFVIAGAFLIYLYKSTTFPKAIANIFSILAGVFSLIAVLGIFKIGPLSTLYKLSVRQRGFYWHAAIEMIKKYPIFGTGFDSYGDYYFQNRSANAAFHSLTTQSNSAHNVFLDIGSSGGLPLLIIYLILTIYVGYRGVKLLKSMVGFNPYLVGLLLAWVGYQAQSVVSINNLGLAVWGWILGGLIVGISSKVEVVTTLKRSPYKRSKENSMSSALIASTLGLIVGLALVLPAFQTDHEYRNALNSRDLNKVLSSVKKWPESTSRTTSTALLLMQNKLSQQGLELAQHVVSINNNSYNAWALIYNGTDPNSALHIKSLKNLRRLNPFDKTLK